MVFRRRTIRRRFTRRRVFRRTGPRARSNRIFRRFIRRKAIRPELKALWYNQGPVSINAGASYTQYGINPNMIQGTNNGQRIGNRVNFVKADIAFAIQNNSSTISTQTPNQQSHQVRVVIWSPRVLASQAVSWWNTFNSTYHNIDYDVCTVHRDIKLQIAPAYVTGPTTGSVAPNPNGLYAQSRRVKIKFPRKADFGTVTTNPAGDVNQDDDMLYISFIAGNLAASVSWQGKLYYFDS